jgi:CRISPR-associated protein (TIGR02710 family)
MSALMIMSLGGSPEPLRKSINAHQPEQIVFLASHDSVSLAGEILKSREPKPAAVYEITEDPNSMFESYKAARRCVDRAGKAGVLPANVVVDYTGGTKVMTAALILAAIGQPYRFNYVGGEKRNKNGLGTVLDGQERMFPEMNPWSIFAEEERRQIVTLFNRRRFSAVLEIIDTCSSRELPEEICSYFAFIRTLAEGLLCWEQFNHEVAGRKIGAGLIALANYLKSHPDPGLEAFSAGMRGCRDFLARLLQETDRLKRLHPILIDDLLNNARRRMADKRYDDAAARIYRALELYGQIIFQEVVGCSNSEVRPDAVPPEIRQEFMGKYYDETKRVLKLPMTATFDFLNRSGNEAGMRFFERKKEIKNIQSSRNESILAHGIRPVGERAAASIWGTVSDFLKFENQLDFPLLP